MYCNIKCVTAVYFHYAPFHALKSWSKARFRPVLPHSPQRGEAGRSHRDDGHWRRLIGLYLSTPFESILSQILGITIKTGNQAAEGRDKLEFYFMDKGHTL